MTRIKSFSRDQRGGTAILFGLLLLPLMAAVGAAVDYSRAANARTGMQMAVDAAALFAARDGVGLSDTELLARTQTFFAANFHKPGTRVEPVEVQKTDTSIRVSARGSIKTAIMGVFNISTVALSATSEVGWGQNRIELALVLDNTGSMAASNKMPELKKAVRDLLAILEKASPNRDAIKISIVPFDTQVNIGTALRNADWLVFDADVPRSLRVQRKDWEGCVADREMPYDADDTAPTNTSTRYPGVACSVSSLAEVRPLTSNFRDLRSTVDAMVPTGNTNITIGVAWGLASLSSGTPLDQAVPLGTKGVEKFMIVLTDGDNTQNRYTSNAADIDARTRKACGEANKAKITVHTIRVIDGNAKLLRDCASAVDNYHEVRNASELGPVFRRIANEIAGIHLTH